MNINRVFYCLLFLILFHFKFSVNVFISRPIVLPFSKRLKTVFTNRITCNECECRSDVATHFHSHTFSIPTFTMVGALPSVWIDGWMDKQDRLFCYCRWCRLSSVWIFQMRTNETHYMC